MLLVTSTVSPPTGRAPHGARGLKFHAVGGGVLADGRAPHGARGLKFAHEDVVVGLVGSRPARGAWIEIPPAPS